MTAEQKIQMIEMRKQGKSYQEIAEQFGVTRQRVHQIVNPIFFNPIRCENRLEKYVFPNIAIWMNENGLSLFDVQELTGIHERTIYGFLTGRTKPRFDSICKIIEVTGMTFEEAFEAKERKL